MISRKFLILMTGLSAFILALMACSTQATSAEPAPTPRLANADVVFVNAVQSRAGSWTFSVSISHPDTGWDDYADGWDVVDANGVVLKSGTDKFTRLLVHPHVGQVPFTRSQRGIEIPTDWVIVRAHDLVDGFGGKTVRVDLTTAKGPGYSVQRY